MYEDTLVLIELSEKDSAEAILAADKRLNFALTPEFKSLISEAGQLSIDDSPVMLISKFDTTYSGFFAIFIKMILHPTVELKDQSSAKRLRISVK